MLYSTVLAEKVLAADVADTSVDVAQHFATYPSYADLPSSGNPPGTKALVVDTSTLYVWIGDANNAVWYPLIIKNNVFSLDDVDNTNGLAVTSHKFDYYVAESKNVTLTATYPNSEEYVVHRLDDTGNHVWSTLLGCTTSNYNAGSRVIHRLYANDDYIYAYGEQPYVVSGQLRNVAMITKLSKSTGSYENLVALPVDVASNPSKCIYSKQSVLGGITSVWTDTVNNNKSLTVARYPDSLYQNGSTINTNSSHFYKTIGLSSLPYGGDWRSAVELDDGSIIVAGSGYESSGSPNYYQWHTLIVIKISPDGTTVTSEIRGTSPTNSGTSGYIPSMPSGDGLVVLPNGNILLGIQRQRSNLYQRESGYIILDSDLNEVSAKSVGGYMLPGDIYSYYLTTWSGIQYHIKGNYLYGYSFSSGNSPVGDMISYVIDLSTHDLVGTSYIWKGTGVPTQFSILNSSNTYIDYIAWQGTLKKNLFHEKIDYPPNLDKWDYPSLSNRVDAEMNIADLPSSFMTTTTTTNPAGYIISNLTPENIYSTHTLTYGGPSSYYNTVQTNYIGINPERILRD